MGEALGYKMAQVHSQGILKRITHGILQKIIIFDIFHSNINVEENNVK